MNLYNFHNKPETLHRYKDREDIVPVLIQDRIHKHLPLNKKQMEVVMYNPFLAFEYATEIIKGRWPEGEDIIMTNKNTTDWYEAFLSEIGYYDRTEDDEDEPRNYRHRNW